MIHSGGDYRSEDLDYILQSAPTQKTLDDAMAGIGFKRKVDHYVHPRTDFFVEFPRGPLSIGADPHISPAELRVRAKTVHALSPTDSCRDRLAAFYYWSDRQGLDAAVAIALRKRVNLRKIREWSAAENALDRYREFLSELRFAKGQTQKKKRLKKRR